MRRDTKIFKTICTVCTISLFHMGLFSLISCDEKSTSTSDNNDDNELECPEGLVGPKGGSLEVTDKDSPYYGVKIIIPEGSLQYCTSLYYNQYYEWHDNGTGFIPQTSRPFNFNLGVFRDGDSVRFRISFPIQNITITDSTSQILCAYHWDPAFPCYNKWHIVIPTEINDSTMIIDTDRFYENWSWGLVSLYEVSYECYLEPLMGDIIGQEKWDDILNQISTTIDTTILADDVSFDCISMLMIRGVFESLYLALGEQMEMYQTVISPIAGNCNVLNPLEFIKGAIDYLGLLALSNFVSIAASIVDGGILSSFITKFMDKAVESSSCNYAAFYQWTDAQFWGFFSLYCFYYMMIHLIDWIVVDTDIIDCPNWTPTTIEWE